MALVAGMAAACALTAPAAAFEPRVPETFFGVSAPQLWSTVVQNRDSERDAQLSGMKAAGIDWVRIEMGWPEIEPNAPAGGVHDYRWAASDRLVAALASRGMELFAMPSATPGWASSPEAATSGCGRRGAVAATRVDDYASFAAALVARYGRAGTFWSERPDLQKVPVTRIELWNEPNWNGFWCPTPDPERFATLVKRAADRIHAVDPSAQVLFGGLAALQDSKHEGETLRGMAVDDFLRRAVAAEPGLPAAIDGVAYHPYDNDAALNLSLVSWLRTKMTSLGFSADTDITITEFGWRTGLVTGAISELLRASNYTVLTGQFARTDCGISAVAAHTWRSPELDLLNPDHWYGLVNTLTGLLHPAGEAYRDQVALYEGRGPEAPPRSVIEVCASETPPDQDDDGTPDETDDYPLDPEQDSGSGETPAPAPEEREEQPRIQPQRVPDRFFGVNVVQLPDDFTRLDEEFAAMRSAQITTARMRIDWSYVEPVPPTDPDYSRRARWSWLDRIVLRMALEGIRLAPAFGALPSWASAGGSAFDAQHAGFAGRVAGRYGPGGSFWEENRHLDEEGLAIRDYEAWQQGNSPAHAADGTASAAEYADTYLALRAAVRAAAPGARAIASLGELGVEGRAGTFLRSMASARPALHGGIDGVHVFAEHSDSVEEVEAAVRDVRFALDDTGNHEAPMSLAFGAATRGTGAMTEAQRAAFFEQVSSRAARGDCGVRTLFPHAWTTPEESETNPWHWYGIAGKLDGALSPTAIAYRDLAAIFGGYAPTQAPLAGLHPCNAQSPDSDGDGTADPADPAPFDSAISTPTAQPPPAPTVGGGPSSPTTSRTAAFSLSAAGAVAYQCKLDDASAFSPCGPQVEHSNLSHGEHVLRVRAVDALGLVGPEAVKRWTVDVVGPGIAAVSGPGRLTPSSEVRFEIRADEPSVRLACRLDAEPWEWCTSPKTYAPLALGTHRFQVGAYDDLDNFGAVHVVEFEVVEPEQPPARPQITSGPAAAAVVGARPRFEFSGTGAASFECRFDGAAFAPCAGASWHEPAAGLPTGTHTFAVRGVGAQGTRGEAATRTFVVDGVGPALEILPLKLSAARRRAVFGFDVEDSSAVSLKCRLDRGSWRSCASPHKLRRLSPGRHTLSAKATDALGNTRTDRIRWRTKRR